MGYIVIVFAVLLVLVAFWFPTFVALKIKQKTFKESVRILFFEVIWVVALVFLADVCGLTNPGGYMLLSLIIVSIGGFFYVLIKRN